MFDLLKCSITSLEEGYDENGKRVLRFFLGSNISGKNCRKYVEVYDLGFPKDSIGLLFEQYRNTLDKE